jgi:hypothetical protein
LRFVGQAAADSIFQDSVSAAFSEVPEQELTDDVLSFPLRFHDSNGFALEPGNRHAGMLFTQLAKVLVLPTAHCGA